MPSGKKENEYSFHSSVMLDIILKGRLFCYMYNLLTAIYTSKKGFLLDKPHACLSELPIANHVIMCITTCNQALTSSVYIHVHVHICTCVPCKCYGRHACFTVRLKILPMVNS